MAAAASSTFASLASTTVSLCPVLAISAPSSMAVEKCTVNFVSPCTVPGCGSTDTTDGCHGPASAPSSARFTRAQAASTRGSTALTLVQLISSPPLRTPPPPWRARRETVLR
jgi:hypothetical protein